MVLTRSSYSRLGTPLASPLQNPDKLGSPSDSSALLKQPGLVRTRSRSRLTALRRQSTGTDAGLSLSPGPSTATSPTRSAPLSLRSPPSPSRSLDGPHSLPPATPVLFQFDFDLMHRLDNTLMDRSPACTNAEVPAPDSNEPSSQRAQQATPSDASSATGRRPAPSRRSRRGAAPASPESAVMPAQQPQTDGPRSASPCPPMEPQLRPATLNPLQSNHSMTQATAPHELPASVLPPLGDLPGCPESQPGTERPGLDPLAENTPESRMPASSSPPDAAVSVEGANTVDCPPIVPGADPTESRVSDSQTVAGAAHTQPCPQSEAQGMLEEAEREGESGGDVIMADASKEAEEMAPEGVPDDAPKEKNDELPKVNSRFVPEDDTEKEEKLADQVKEAGIATWNEQSEKEKTVDKELSMEEGQVGEAKTADEAENEKEGEKDKSVEKVKPEEVEVLSKHVDEREAQEKDSLERAKSQGDDVAAEDGSAKGDQDELAESAKAKKVEAMSDNEGEGESAEYRTAEEADVVSEELSEDGEENDLAEKSKAQKVDLELELESGNDEEEDEDELANMAKPQQVERELKRRSQKAAKQDQLAKKATMADAEVESGDESSSEDEEDQLAEEAKAEGIEVGPEDGCNREVEASVKIMKRQDVERVGEEGEDEEEEEEVEEKEEEEEEDEESEDEKGNGRVKIVSEDESADEKHSADKKKLQELESGSEDEDEEMWLAKSKEVVEISSSDESEEDEVVEKDQAMPDAGEAAGEASDSSEADEELAGQQQKLVQTVSESSSSEEAATDTDSDEGRSSSSDENDEELDGLLAKARARMRDPSLLANVIPLESASPAAQVKVHADAGTKKEILSKPLVGSQLSAVSVGAKRKSGIVIQDRFGGESSSLSKTRKMDWHELPRQEVTPEVKREIQAMRLHRTLDPKSFVKGGLEKSLKEPIPDRFMFGHVISAVEPSSSSSKPKKRSFVESLVGDEKSKSWTKRKYVEEIQASGSSGGKEFWKALKKKRQR